jgi:hypothetical protein
METLVLCSCGHTLAQHDYDGCAGDRLRSCLCPRDRESALFSAVDQASFRPGRPALRQAGGSDAA